MLRRTFILGTAAAALAGQQSGSSSDDLGSIAYIQGGTLWIKRLPDGQASALATGNNIFRPKFSPSGHWILFCDGDDLLRVVSADGKSQKSWPTDPSETAGQWLPGELDRLAVVLNDYMLVFAPDDDWTSSPIALPGKIGAISPDGNQRVWESTDDDGTRLLTGPFDRPTEATLVARTKEGGFEVFAFVQAGSRFLYWMNEEEGADSWGHLDIYLGGGANPVRTGTSSMTTGIGPAMASLSPTSDTVAIVVGEDANVTNHLKGIALLDVSSDSSQPLRKITGPSVSALYPAWSPDGRQLAWMQGPDSDVLYDQLPEGTLGEVAMERASRERRIWLAANGGLGEQKQLTNDPRYTDEVPIWSRDGKYILFGRSDAQDAGTVWLMRADGSDAREVAAPSDGTVLLDLSDLYDWSSRFSNR